MVIEYSLYFITNWWCFNPVNTDKQPCEHWQATLWTLTSNPVNTPRAPGLTKQCEHILHSKNKRFYFIYRNTPYLFRLIRQWPLREEGNCSYFIPLFHSPSTGLLSNVSSWSNFSEVDNQCMTIVFQVDAAEMSSAKKAALSARRHRA